MADGGGRGRDRAEGDQLAAGQVVRRYHVHRDGRRGHRLQQEEPQEPCPSLCAAAWHWRCGGALSLMWRRGGGGMPLVLRMTFVMATATYPLIHSPLLCLIHIFFAFLCSCVPPARHFSLGTTCVPCTCRPSTCFRRGYRSDRHPLAPARAFNGSRSRSPTSRAVPTKSR